MRQTLGGNMRAVRRRKRVIHIDVSIGGDGARQFWIVLFLARPETGVLQQGDVSIAQNANRLFDDIAGDLRHKHHLEAQHLVDGGQH